MAEVCAQHLRDAVLKVVTGYGEACGGALLSHPGIATISFTGSTEVGRIAMRAAASASCRCRSNSAARPSLVYPDSNDDATVTHVIAAMRCARQGQSCTAGSRLHVHRSTFDDFTAKLVERLDELVVGAALDERSDIGSTVSAIQDGRVCGYVREALEKGTIALTGGLPDDERRGYQLRPTVLTGAEHSWAVAREEVFGPVLVRDIGRLIARVLRQAEPPARSTPTSRRCATDTADGHTSPASSPSELDPQQGCSSVRNAAPATAAAHPGTDAMRRADVRGAASAC